MRVLFTGASSFTGTWFVRELAAAGHQVVAPLRGDGVYDGVRARRIRLVREIAEVRPDCRFGSDGFLELIETAPGGFDVLCHHAAEVGDYRSPDFDPYRAAAANLHRLPEILAALAARGCRRIVLTGSVFEPNEGEGDPPLRAFSPYGLSKGLTATAAEFYAGRAGLGFAKFVIANPFGPCEEPRFTSYLVRTWLNGETARVQTPAYVRDNIPVDLLARAYAGFVGSASVGRTGPSFYRESQGDFAARVRAAAVARLGLPCALEFAEQTEFPEPAKRVNTDPLDPARLGWDEAAFWDSFFAYYRD